MPGAAFDPSAYDYSADLILREGREDDGVLDVQSPLPAEQDPELLAAYDASVDLRLEAGDGPAVPHRAGYQPAESPLIRMQPPAEASDAGSQGPARDLQIDDAEDFLFDLPRKPEEPAGTGASWNVASVAAPAGMRSELAAVAAEAESAISARLAVARSKSNSRRGRGPGRPGGRLSWLLQLESWLVLAALSLFFQVFPAAFWRVMAVVDVRNWTWGVWVGVEIAVIAVLLLLRVRQAADA